ncbi:MAG TPA: 2-oxoglutarate dehydrogenase, E2 component, dihydrolipoamide succinyltransferase [Gemmatimonadaceae bacterium]|nr:2-oxoglutarate dehydrogenase, E2 component, dihydrolipoamide succinyltransferase [Gemmatimonadaceae bacterium]
MARVDVPMPQMGESIAEGTLSRWIKKLGDDVKRDEPMFEISTDKVDAEVSAPNAGTIVEILVTEGQTVPVGAVVARLETEKGAAVATPVAAAPAPAAPAPRAAAPAPSAPSAPPGPRSPGPGPRSPVPASVSSSGGNGSSLEERLRTKSSPLVRKMAAEHGVELATLSGTGIAGRVTKRDLEAYLESGAAVAPAPAPARAAAHAPAADPHAPMPVAWPGDVVEPMSRIRQLTAEHMVLARRTAMHVTTVFEVDLTRIAAIRAKHRAAFEARTGEKLTYLPFIVQAVLGALKQVPILNATVAGNDIIYRKSYNIGIAVALDWGLIVPVLKNADDYSLTGLARTLNDLSGRARTKKLKPEEVQDCTFSITNHGVFGSLFATPIVPVPTTGILGVGAIEKRPKVLKGAEGEDVIAIRTCTYLSLSFDHRVVDGAGADRFVAIVKDSLENISDPSF